MSSKAPVTFTLAAAENCPGSATTAAGATTLDIGMGFTSVEAFATLTGPTGGTLDVYIQDSIDGAAWRDWVHFAQVAATVVSNQHACASLSNSTTAIGIGTTASPGVGLAAASVRPGHPGPKLRAVYVCGVGTSVAAAQTIRIECVRNGQ
jgi:hypothetical protein